MTATGGRGGNLTRAPGTLKYDGPTQTYRFEMFSGEIWQFDINGAVSSVDNGSGQLVQIDRDPTREH